MRTFWLFSLLIVSACIGIDASAIHTQQENQHPQISSHVFHSMNNNNDYNFFFSHVSSICNISSIDLQNKPSVMTANASIIRQGCLGWDTMKCTSDFMSSPMVFDCSCEPILSNTAWLYGNATAFGGKVCQVSVNVNIVATTTQSGKTITLNENIQQTTPQLFVLGNECTGQDIQTSLGFVVKYLFGAVSNLEARGFTVPHYHMSASACGLSSVLTNGGADDQKSLL